MPYKRQRLTVEDSVTITKPEDAVNVDKEAVSGIETGSFVNDTQELAKEKLKKASELLDLAFKADEGSQLRQTVIARIA